ncbi:MAG: cysteine--tRNA ligase [Candidatus Sungbacteria bacterium]|nr:cysteine--tRNA ligase [Candidatus Sungbacteria bacterium]
MQLKLYNTLTRTKEDFKPLKADRVGLYTCGPTVYNYAHIGNLRTYIFEDILRRTLEYAGYVVFHVMNITDVGHLTSDADEGEDKLEKSASTLADVQAIVQKYTSAFFEDMRALHIKEPHVIAPASQYVAEQQSIIKELFKREFAYETSQAVYFDVSKLPDYGKLTGQAFESQRIAARDTIVTDSEKSHSQDFALWFKRVGRFAGHIQYWSSPWGDGFPGWHIECSAISTKFLGQPFDIHTGGVDHIGTHHTNEIAQSEAAFGKPLACYWLHGEFLNIEGAKMAKSGENFITLSILQERGYTALDFRYFALLAKYRAPLQFTEGALDAAQAALLRIRERISVLKKKTGWSFLPQFLNNEAKADLKKFEEAAFDDLNTPAAIAILQSSLASSAYNSRTKLRLVGIFDRILGLKLLEQPIGTLRETPSEVFRLMREREEARKGKDWEGADTIRKEIENLGWTVEDTPHGPIPRKAK